MKFFKYLCVGAIALTIGLALEENRPEENNIAAGDHYVYLNLTKVGELTGSEKGKINEGTLYLEDSVKYVAESGSTLPGVEEVISTSKDVKFQSWIAYDGKGTATIYDKVPAEKGKVLYAYFTYTGEFSGGGDTPIPDTDWYIAGEGSFINGTEWAASGGIKMTLNENYTGTGSEYMALGIEFQTGDKFKLRKGDTNQWIANGWESENGAFSEGLIALDNDNHGGYNILVNENCKLDIYFKDYENGSYNCYIGVAQ